MAVSPSLLAGVKPVLEDWIPPRELLLGMGEPWEPFPWDPCYDTENLNVDLLAASQQYEAVLQNSIDEENVDSLLLAASQDYEKSTEVSSRWAPPTDSSEISTLRKSGVPQKTQNQTNWALRVWSDWALYRQRNLVEDDETLHPLQDNFVEMDKIDMAFWLCKFVTEARRRDKEPYPPDTLYSLCCSLFRALKESDRADVKPFEDPVFAAFTSTLDAQMKALKSSGMHQPRQAEVISEDMEDTLWGKGLLGDSSPQQLLDTLVFYIGLYFALRSGSEHRRLRHRPSQIQLVELPNGSAHLVYRETVSKTNQGGLKQRKKLPKEVIQKENKDDPRKCLVRLYKLYNSKCPLDRPDGALYLKPLVHFTADVWYSKTAVGHNTLASTVKRLMTAGGIEGHYSNHSLRRTAATRLFEAGVDEQLIMLRTGHSSASGVRSYKRVSEQLKEVTSDVLNGVQTTKKTKLEGESAVVCTLPPAANGGVPASPVLPLPQMNFAGASNFNISINYNK